MLPMGLEDGPEVADRNAMVRKHPILMDGDSRIGVWSLVSF